LAVLKRFGGFTGLWVVGFVLLALFFRDWLVIGTLAVVFAIIWFGQAVARSRSRRRMSEAHLSGSDRWRGRVVQEGESLFGGRIWWSLANDGVTADLVANPDSLLLEPTKLGRKWGRLQSVAVPWTDVVSARTRDLGRETPDGKISFVPLTGVTLLIVGDLVPIIMRPDDYLADAELSAKEQAEIDKDIAGYLEAVRETVGSDYVFGVLPLQFITPDATGLVDAVAARARGNTRSPSPAFPARPRCRKA